MPALSSTLSTPRRILLVSDAWHPQVSGVVRTLSTVSEELRHRGHEMTVLSPGDFWTVPCPTYPDIPLALVDEQQVSKKLSGKIFDALHIATEGPLGLAARAWALRRRFPFTTSFHTRFPEYLYARFRIPTRWVYRLMTWFHTRAERTLVATEALKNELVLKGFTKLVVWSRGVDVSLFRPRPKDVYPWPGPIFLYLGRVAVEKNIPQFLNLDLPGTKVVVGDGPDLLSLQRAFPKVHFVGKKTGEDLARHVAGADVMVFPSLTDTFGLVLLEAMASGVPVAAYPVRGPLDVVKEGVTGRLDWNLRRAALEALSLSPEDCRQHASRYSWSACTDTFLSHLAPISRRSPNSEVDPLT